MKSEKELIPCLFCDSDNFGGVNNLEVIEVLIDEGSPYNYYDPEPPTYGKTVRCNNCGAQGPEVEIEPYGDAEQEAIAAWNRRANQELPTLEEIKEMADQIEERDRKANLWGQE